jgi:hypothetical protein
MWNRLSKLLFQCKPMMRSSAGLFPQSAKYICAYIPTNVHTQHMYICNICTYVPNICMWICFICMHVRFRCIYIRNICSCNLCMWICFICMYIYIYTYIWTPHKNSCECLCRESEPAGNHLESSMYVHMYAGVPAYVNMYVLPANP